MPGEPVVARRAATVILLRDADLGPEVFLMRRHQRSGFVGGAHVFPGGSVDDADEDAEDLCAGLDDVEASRRLQLESGGLAYYVAAIRECFEEAGVALAYDAEGRLVDLDDEARRRRIERARAELNAGRLDFRDLARSEGWRLATDHLHYWAHWITPESEPRRFDTRFFLATSPRRQVAAHDDHELTDSDWIRPTDALDRARRREWTIIFPTLRNLMTLVDFASCEMAVEAGRRRGSVETLQPRILRTAGGIQAVLPGDPGWDDAVASEGSGG